MSANWQGYAIWAAQQRISISGLWNGKAAGSLPPFYRKFPDNYSPVIEASEMFFNLSTKTSFLVICSSLLKMRSFHISCNCAVRSEWSQYVQAAYRLLIRTSVVKFAFTISGIPQAVCSSIKATQSNRCRNFSAMKKRPRRWTSTRISPWRGKEILHRCLTNCWHEHTWKTMIRPFKILLDVLLDVCNSGLFEKK